MLRAGVPALLAGGSVVMIMIGLYLVLPEPTRDDPPWLTFTSILVVSIVYAAAGVWSVARISRAKHPLRTGVVMLAVMVTAMVVIFSLTYLSLSVDNPANFNVPLDKINALYFTMTILSTVGFGDITAATHAAMIAVMIQMVVGLTLITTLARVLMEAARRAARRRFDEPAQLAAGDDPA